MEFYLKLFLIFIFSISISWAQSRMVNKTREALLSYSIVQEKSDEVIEKVKRETLGDHAEKLLFIAPLVTGKFEVNAYKMNFYYDHRSDHEAGVRYNLKF